MSLPRRRSVGLCLICLATLVALSWAPAYCQEPADKPAKSGASKAAKDDPFVVPEGGPAELVEYLKGLQAGLMKVRSELPEKRDRESIINYRRKVIRYMVQSAKPQWEAADKILADAGATPAQMAIAAQAKCQALMLLSNFGDEKVDAALKALPDELTKLGMPELAEQVRIALLRQELQKSLTGAPGAKPLAELVDQTKKMVVAKPDKTAQMLVHMLVEGVQKTDSVEAAVALCNEFTEALAKSDAPGAADLVKRIEGYARRMQLMGSTMEIEGTLLDGKPLDWASYKGKVVLVQFWATWCGPCRAEIPNVRKYYDLYHDRGFDVVSIDMDEKRETAEKFVEENDIPWPVIFEPGKQNAGFDTPMAIRYAVTGIPTLILIDRDGKVVSEQARGPNLGELLEKLIGPAEQKKDKDNKDDKK